MARSKLAQGQSRSKSGTKARGPASTLRSVKAAAPTKEQGDGLEEAVIREMQADQQMLAAELRGVSESLAEALGDIIEAHVDEDVQAFTYALRRVNSARVVLMGEAEKLEAVQP